MLAVVSDSSPLIYLTRLGWLSLLRELHDSVFVPPAVWEEIAVGGEGLPESAALRDAVTRGWIKVKSPSANEATLGKAAEQLGRADVEAILLARELQAILLTDDSEVRDLAESIAVKVSGTVGLLVRAKREKRIDCLKPILDQLRTQTNFHIGEKLYQAALRDAGEALDNQL